MTKFEITPNTIIADLLNKYPELEDKLIEIAPVFKKLKNPILRRTIAKITSLRQAAIIGKVQLSEMINTLRKTIGQDSIELIDNSAVKEQSVPDWIKDDKIKMQYDAREDLESGIHPITQVLKETATLNDGEIYLLITPFTPLPLIDRLNEKGFECFSVNKEENVVNTYITKK